MPNSRGRGLLARRRVGRYVRRAGWFVFWGAAAWTLVANTIADKLVLAPIVIGLCVLAVTEAAAWLLKRYRDQLRSAGKLPERSLRRPQPSVATAPATASPVTSVEYAGAASGHETPPRRFGLFSPRAAAAPAPKDARLKRAKRVLIYSAIALPVLAIGLAWLCLDDHPLVAKRAESKEASDTEVQQQPIEPHDRPDPGGETARTIVASQADVADFISQRFHDAAVQVTLRPSLAVLHASVPVRVGPFGKWINIDAVLHEIGGRPTIENFKVGSLRVPAVVADYAMGLFLERFNGTRHVIRSVTMLESQVRVVYE